MKEKGHLFTCSGPPPLPHLPNHVHDELIDWNFLDLVPPCCVGDKSSGYSWRLLLFVCFFLHLKFTHFTHTIDFFLPDHGFLVIPPSHSFTSTTEFLQKVPQNLTRILPFWWLLLPNLWDSYLRFWLVFLDSSHFSHFPQLLRALSICPQTVCTYYLASSSPITCFKRRFFSDCEKFSSSALSFYSPHWSFHSPWQLLLTQIKFCQFLSKNLTVHWFLPANSDICEDIMQKKPAKNFNAKLLILRSLSSRSHWSLPFKVKRGIFDSGQL